MVEGSAITYVEADDIVERYVREKIETRPRTTSRDVARWADVDYTTHNRIRLHDALERVCERTDTNWAGRTVFALPEELP